MTSLEATKQLNISIAWDYFSCACIRSAASIHKRSCVNTFFNLLVRSTSYMNMNAVTGVCMHICTRRSKICLALLMPYDMLCVHTKSLLVQLCLGAFGATLHTS